MAEIMDHERIWLQNAADAEAAGQQEGRQWCQDKVWPDDAEDGEPTEYVRADLLAAANKRADEAEAELQSKTPAEADVRSSSEDEVQRQQERIAVLEGFDPIEDRLALQCRIAVLEKALERIAEFNSGDDASLGALLTLSRVRAIARALTQAGASAASAEGK